ncbi:site-specific integrase [Promicromonospora sp. MEB111]|uniref:tyrosine-type recombinase/integrase n=1 Tax=Promicromonospora sp. MEB111 TaxID=3040301 RepID=UPI00254F1EE7|nr:site-specific integrase [Promicromonospora sp. MEB111]
MRARIPAGTFGDVYIAQTSPSSWRSRTRFRDQDGMLRLVEASGPTAKTAEQALKVKLAHRTRMAGVGELHPHSPFPDLVRVWLEDLELDPDLAQGTKDLYERDMRTLVVPVFEHFVLREITISKVDRFLRTLANQSYSRAKHAKVVLNLALGMAHRYEAIEKNPVTGTKRLKRPATQATALTLEQIQAIRVAARTWRRGDAKVPGPKPDGQLEVIIEVMLGSSLRIGEVLALRKRDIDLTTTPATLRVAGTIVSPKGRPTYRQPHPKTRTSVRRIAIPSYTATALRDRLVDLAGHEPGTLVFRTRNGTPLTTNNIRRRLRDVLATAGTTGVTPHSFRRTVATTIERAAGADLAAQLLGHTSSEITVKHYIEPNTSIDTRTATILETLTPTTTTSQASGTPSTAKISGDATRT